MSEIKKRKRKRKRKIEKLKKKDFKEYAKHEISGGLVFGIFFIICAFIFNPGTWEFDWKAFYIALFCIVIFLGFGLFMTFRNWINYLKDEQNTY